MHKYDGFTDFILLEGLFTYAQEMGCLNPKRGSQEVKCRQHRNFKIEVKQHNNTMTLFISTHLTV